MHKALTDRVSQFAALQIMCALHRWMSIQSTTCTKSQGNCTAAEALHASSSEAFIRAKIRTV